MSTDGPQPTQGAPKKKRKKKESRSVVFWDCFFVPCFLFLFFGGPLSESEISSPLPDALGGACSTAPNGYV
jgi:hypothetical protein